MFVTSTSHQGLEVKAILRVEGFVRLACLLTTIVAFSCIADIGSYNLSSNLTFTLVANLMSFIWVMLALGIMTCYPILAPHLPHLPLVYLGLDAVLALFTFIGGITAAVWCSDYCSIQPQKVVNNVRAASTFSFFTWILLLSCIYFSFSRYQQEKNGGARATSSQGNYDASDNVPYHNGSGVPYTGGNAPYGAPVDNPPYGAHGGNAPYNVSSAGPYTQVE